MGEQAEELILFGFWGVDSSRCIMPPGGKSFSELLLEDQGFLEESVPSYYSASPRASMLEEENRAATVLGDLGVPVVLVEDEVVSADEEIDVSATDADTEINPASVADTSSGIQRTNVSPPTETAKSRPEPERVGASPVPEPEHSEFIETTRTAASLLR